MLARASVKRVVVREEHSSIPSEVGRAGVVQEVPNARSSQSTRAKLVREWSGKTHVATVSHANVVGAVLKGRAYTYQG